MLDEAVVRQEKLHALKKRGIDPYPERGNRTHLIHKVLESFDVLEKKAATMTLCGRVRSIRKHGGLTFLHLEDGSDKIQAALKKDKIGAGNYDDFHNFFDIGDFIEISGTLFRTKLGEKTIDAGALRLLSKSLLPLPEKFHGLSDVELRYRKRYLDLLANAEIRKNFETRSLLVKILRNFMDSKGFLEVETPILQPLAGGAAARPFRTHHNALDMDLYLRIAPELYLKRLIVGGFEKVYEIARCFRNEGIDRDHNPEFTQLEFYWAYADYEDLMKMTEEMLSLVLKQTAGANHIVHDGVKIDFKFPLRRRTFAELVKENTGLDVNKGWTEESLRKELKKLKIQLDDSGVHGLGELYDELYKETVRPKIIQPLFVTDYPVEMIPLAKRKAREASKISSFQLVVKGAELIKAYNELNDPLDQEERFREQEAMRKAGAEEAMRIDNDFLEALRHGMPPCAGFGMGLDRLAALLTGSHSLKEIILFPTLRPEKTV
ncbi:lysine--tRNA ligase [Candidatus Uhrbacteria bacterium]|nr:lysine--tRNA ligase [Candidatus Uhrbacteria bacterium]